MLCNGCGLPFGVDPPMCTRCWARIPGSIRWNLQQTANPKDAKACYEKQAERQARAKSKKLQAHMHWYRSEFDSQAYFKERLRVVVEARKKELAKQSAKFQGLLGSWDISQRKDTMTACTRFSKSHDP